MIEVLKAVHCADRGGIVKSAVKKPVSRWPGSASRRPAFRRMAEGNRIVSLGPTGDEIKVKQTHRLAFHPVAVTCLLSRWASRNGQLPVSAVVNLLALASKLQALDVAEP